MSLTSQPNIDSWIDGKRHTVDGIDTEHQQIDRVIKVQAGIVTTSGFSSPAVTGNLDVDVGRRDDQCFSMGHALSQ